MKVLMCLLAVSVLYSISSFVSYTKEFRDSNWILPLNWSVALVSSTLWIVMIRSLNDTNKIITASMAWDIIVTVAYAVIPAFMQGKNLSWQAYAALFVVLVSLIWFKVSCE